MRVSHQIEVALSCCFTKCGAYRISIASVPSVCSFSSNAWLDLFVLHVSLEHPANPGIEERSSWLKMTQAARLCVLLILIPAMRHARYLWRVSQAGQRSER